MAYGEQWTVRPLILIGIYSERSWQKCYLTCICDTILIKFPVEILSVNPCGYICQILSKCLKENNNRNINKTHLSTRYFNDVALFPMVSVISQVMQSIVRNRAFAFLGYCEQPRNILQILCQHYEGFFTQRPSHPSQARLVCQ